jgi:hypothetical protein
LTIEEDVDIYRLERRYKQKEIHTRWGEKRTKKRRGMGIQERNGNMRVRATR